MADELRLTGDSFHMMATFLREGSGLAGGLALIVEAESSADAVEIGEVMAKGEKSHCRGKTKEGGRFKNAQECANP